MSNAANSKKDRRDHAREVAREMREAERKRRARNRIFLQGGVILGVIAIAVVVVLVVISVNKPAGPGPANMASGGIEFVQSGTDATKAVTTAATAVSATPVDNPVDNADGKAHIIEYIDWACPICKQFETTYADTVLSLVKSGNATVEFRPVAILDGSFQGSRYASRAANVAACMANYDPEQYIDAQTAFYANQPEEQTTGLTDDAMLSLLTGAGIDITKKYSDGVSLTDCVTNEQFKGWVTATTQRALVNAANPSTGSFGTPTVYVNGSRWDNSTEFSSFMSSAVSAAAAGSSTSSPTPTAAPTN